ncbi:MAG: hypothetical protein AAGC64_05630 [Bacteroidota bacterium]
MIKEFFLNYRSKPNPTLGNHSTYEKAKSIGVLYNADEFQNSLITNLIEILKKDGKIVMKLGFVEKTNDPKTSEDFIFTRKDISGTGSIKKNNLSAFANQSFDFLISLNTVENINYKYILATCKAICKVGLETKAYQDLLLMSLRISAKKENAIKNLIKYLRKI